MDIEGDTYPGQTAHMFSGSIGNWKPQKMYEISTYCKMLDPQGKHESLMITEPLLLHALKNRKEIPREAETVLDLTERQR